MTNAERKQWLIDNGFEYVCTDKFDETYEKYTRFTRSTWSNDPSPFLLQVHVSLNEKQKPWAELHAGSLSFGSERLDSPREAVDAVMNELLHLLESMKHAAETVKTW